MPFVLERHQYENDRNLNFADYRYQLRNKTWDGSALRTIQLEALVLAAFVLHATLEIDQGMLSYDAQRLLARYDVVAGEWRDTTTGQAVDPIAHIVDVLNRLDS